MNPNRRLPGLLAVALAAALTAACSSSVRLATPAEVRQATAPTPAPPAATGPGAGSGGASAPGAPVGLAQLQSELRQLVDQVTPSVVQIDTGSGTGSGVITDATGTIVTNAHVIAGATSLTVTTSDGKTYAGTVAGASTANDLALIKLTGASGLKPAAFGDSTAVRIGDIVLAIGSPLGLSDSVSEGIISGTGRSESEGGGITLSDLIQTTAAINPGNSGGALVDISGKVIGVPTLGATSSPRGGGASGIGFAISSSTVLRVIAQLAAGGGTPAAHSGIAYLGITTTSASGGGATIGSVVTGGPAEKAGVQPGWVIVSIANHPVADATAISQILGGYQPGDKVSLTARLPNGSTSTLSITLGERPATP